MRRNVPPAYRLAAIALDDPVLAQDVVHDSAMAAWQAGSTWPAHSLDDVFARRLATFYRSAARDSHERREPAPPADPLETAFLTLDPDERVLLVERLVLPDEIPSLPRPFRAGRNPEQRAQNLLARLAEATPPSADPSPARNPSIVAERLRVLLAERDPGDEPSDLRFRLQRSLFEMERATAEQAEIAAKAGWGFAVDIVLVMAIVVLAITVASVNEIRAAERAAGTHVGTQSNVRVYSPPPPRAKLSTSVPGHGSPLNSTPSRVFRSAGQ